jgi:hypothetical protein
MRDVPQMLLHRPFARSEALALGVSGRVLEGTRFVRVHPRVYRHRDHEMTFGDEVAAARLALPGDAYPTGITRMRLLGLEIGPAYPLRFVVEGDLHLALDGIFLHRTVLLPPTDEVGVTPAAAYLAFCRRARTIDAIGVGDWLLHRGHLDADELRALVTAQPWRDGAAEAAWVLDHLVGDARSLRESEVRSCLTFAGLPPPQPNGPIALGAVAVHGDLWFAAYRTAVEYEGVQHQADRGQYVSDIDRYALYRRHDVHYVQVTTEKLRTPRAVVREVHESLVRGGYTGSAPDFGATWDLLFARLSRLVPRSRRRLRAVA